MKKNLFRFCTKICILFLALFMMDQAAGLLLEKIYFGQKSGQLAEATYSIDSTYHDILIFGSSRAHHHYSPSIITEQLPGLSCYNVGRDGQRCPYYTAIQEVILKRTKPKLIILDILSNEFNNDNAKYDHLTALLPYCNIHPELKKYVEEISPYEKYKLYSKTYAYNSLFFIMGYEYFFGTKSLKTDNGFTPLERTLTKENMKQLIRETEADVHNIDRDDSTIDQKAVNYYIQFLNTASRLHIKTLVMISPSVFGEKNTKKKNLIKTITSAYPDVRLYDLGNDTNYVSKNEKFYDLYHLNKEGAYEFSRQVANYVRENLYNSNDQSAHLTQVRN